jgi:hypothetical protein
LESSTIISPGEIIKRKCSYNKQLSGRNLKGLFRTSLQKHQTLTQTADAYRKIRRLQKDQTLTQTADAYRKIRRLQKDQTLTETADAYRKIRRLQKDQTLTETSDAYRNIRNFTGILTGIILRGMYDNMTSASYQDKSPTSYIAPK